jgi:hypothetical protein
VSDTAEMNKKQKEEIIVDGKGRDHFSIRILALFKH